jgi:DNA-binding response OmpR family regulator
VEDDAALREALSDALRDEGFSVAAIVASHCGAPEGGL